MRSAELVKGQCYAYSDTPIVRLSTFVGKVRVEDPTLRAPKRGRQQGPMLVRMQGERKQQGSDPFVGRLVAIRMPWAEYVELRTAWVTAAMGAAVEANATRKRVAKAAARLKKAGIVVLAHDDRLSIWDDQLERLVELVEKGAG